MRDPDRKGKVESGVGHAQRTPLKGQRFESLEEAQAYLVSDELSRRSERLLDRRRKQAEFRDAHKTLDQFDFNFNPTMNRSLVFDLATSLSSASGKTPCFSARAAPARVTWPRPSAERPNHTGRRAIQLLAHVIEHGLIHVKNSVIRTQDAGHRVWHRNVSKLGF